MRIHDHASQGLVSKLKYAKFPLCLAIHLDVLTPLKVNNVSMQKDEHDPVSMLHHVQEFRGIVANLKALVASSLDSTTSRLTDYTKFIQEVLKNEDEDGCYQNVKKKVSPTYNHFVSILDMNIDGLQMIVL